MPGWPKRLLNWSRKKAEDTRNRLFYYGESAVYAAWYFTPLSYELVPLRRQPNSVWPAPLQLCRLIKSRKLKLGIPALTSGRTGTFV